MSAIQDVSSHNTPEDAWVTYKGKVLNITSFIHSHPGGDSTLLPYLGQDITEAFESVSHSEYAESLIPTLYQSESLKQKECLIDPYKGTFYQVWSKMNLKSYTEFVNTPKLIKGHMRVFDSPLLEPLSKTPWQLIPMIWLPIISYWMMVGILEGGALALAWFLAGLCYWTLFEYLLHRFGFHSESYLPDNRYVICIHYLLHGIHHAYPMDSLRLVFPPVLGFSFCYFFKSIYNLYIPFPFSHAFMAGKILGYVYYDLFHYFSHHRDLKNGYIGFMKKYHLSHHYKNSLQGFGVSNHFWDLVFGTQLTLD